MGAKFGTSALSISTASTWHTSYFSRTSQASNTTQRRGKTSSHLVIAMVACCIVPLDLRVEQLQLRYIGHVTIMTFTCIQKRIFHSKPPDATFTSKGKRAFSYNLAGALRHFAIDPDTWEETASYRKAWRSAISAKGTEYYMEKWLVERRIARQHRRDNEVARANRRAAQPGGCRGGGGVSRVSSTTPGEPAR